MMSNSVYLKLGRCLFAVAILAIGIIHIVTRDFPTGLLPVAAAVPDREMLVYITGAALIIASLMILIKRLAYYGALLTGVIWLLMLILVHLPKLIPNTHDGAEWTVAFEVIIMLSGALLLAGTSNNKAVLMGKWFFLSALVAFTVLHYVYLPFIAMLVPAWLPGHLFWAWLVLIAFFAASVSLLFNQMVKLSQLLVAIMLLLWVLILHLPRVIGSPHLEPEWTSLFVALATSGVALLVAGSARK